MSLKLSAAALAAVLFAAPGLALAQNPPACAAPNPPANATAVLPAVRTCIINNSRAGDCGANRFDVKVFQNREARLPAVGAGQSYYEAKIRNAGQPAGTLRWVILANTNVNPRTLGNQYYTNDHYATFCRY